MDQDVKTLDLETKKKIVQIVAAAATFLLVLMVCGLIINIITMVQLSSRKNKLNNQLAALVDLNKDAVAEIDYRFSDSYIERYAREQLDMKKTDEFTFVFAER